MKGFRGVKLTSACVFILLSACISRSHKNAATSDTLDSKVSVEPPKIVYVGSEMPQKVQLYAPKVGIALSKSVVPGAVNLKLRHGSSSELDVMNLESGSWFKLASVERLAENSAWKSDAESLSNCDRDDLVDLKIYFYESQKDASVYRNSLHVCDTDDDGDCSGSAVVCLKSNQHIKLSKSGCTPYREDVGISSNPHEIKRKAIKLKCRN